MISLPVIIGRDTTSPLFVARCDVSACPVRRAPPPGMSALEAFTKGFCQREGCWRTSAFTLDKLKAVLAANGDTITNPTFHA